ncbi:MAG: TM2 domain-containing protein [Coriobacteriales bacterium]|jgi:TM2 domain-containing membrane protein YozV|nr:TM2 domain-containing protein [Coriobacteriales bacterium]
MSDTVTPNTSQSPQEPPTSAPRPQTQPGPGDAPTEPRPSSETGSSAAQAASSYPYADQQGYQQAYQQTYQQQQQQQQQTAPPPGAQQGSPYTQQQGYQYTPAPQGQMYPGAKPTRYRKERLVAGILALTLGPFGAHKFYLGYTTEAVIMLLLLTVGSCLVLGPAAAAIIALIEGITYLLKSDEEFEQLYVYNKKGWF